MATRKLTYNCDPESLGDVSKENFAAAFNAACAADSDLRKFEIEATFLSGASRITALDGDLGDPERYAVDVDNAVERAYRACCESD